MESWSGAKPGATIYGLAEGQAVPDSWEIMKVYGKDPINWEGTFKGAEPASDRHEGQVIKIKIEMDKLPQGGMVFLYARASAADKWKQVAPGARVKFRGKIAGIMFDYLPIRGG